MRACVPETVSACLGAGEVAWGSSSRVVDCLAVPQTYILNYNTGLGRYSEAGARGAGRGVFTDDHG